MTFPNVTAGVGELIAEQFISIRQADRLPSIVMQVVDEFGTPIDLTDKTAWLVVRKIESGNGGGTWGIPRQTLIFDYEQGVVVYDWQESDTATSDPGTYELVIEIRFANGDLDFTVPTRRDSFIVVRSAVVDISGVVFDGPPLIG